MKKKIFLYNIILVSIGIFITGFSIAKLSQVVYQDESEVELTSNAAIIKEYITTILKYDEAPDYNEIVKNLSHVVNSSKPKHLKNNLYHIRITIINNSGKVLGDSEANINFMENHLKRKEIQEALNGSIGIDIRESNTLHIDSIYVAVPVDGYNMIIRTSAPLIKIDRIKNIIFYYSILGILAGLILTSILAFKFSHSLTKPIFKLIEASDKIASGIYSDKLEIETNDELGHLGLKFNEMASQLQENLNNLINENSKIELIINSIINGIIAVDKNYNILLINNMACEIFNINDKNSILGKNFFNVIVNENVSQIFKQTIDNDESHIKEINTGFNGKVLKFYSTPIKLNKDTKINSGGILLVHDITNLKKLELIRTEFVSNVTHELKTPLTSIRGFVETLRNGAIDNPVVSNKFLEIIDIESERLYMLINDILHLSEIETKQTDNNIDKYELNTIISEVVQSLTGIAEKKTIKINYICDNSIIINANKDRIKQMLINLIDNGIKYNIENGFVNLHVLEKNNSIIFKVKDSGIGISQEHIERIFERFYRVDKGRSRSAGGTGLGLSIVKHIVHLYNGEIKVSSTLNSGTEFTIIIPQ